MVWAEYGTIKDDVFIPACGDRAVIILDGRYRLDALIDTAIVNNGHRRPVYEAVQLFKGPRFTESKPLTKPIKLIVRID